MFNTADDPLRILPSLITACPLISIIVPVKDASAYLRACCLSILSQTYQNWEALLIDDDSADESYAIGKCWTKKDPRFRLIASGRKEADVPGPWLPRNVGIAEAKGNFIAFLDADDLWHPRKLEAQLGMADQHTNLDMSTTGYLRFRSADGRIIEKRTPPDRISPAELLAFNPIPLSSVLMKRCLLGNGFRAVPHEDHDAWIRLFHEQTPRIYRVREPLMAYRLHQRNLTRGFRHRWELRRGLMMQLPAAINKTTQSNLRFLWGQSSYLLASLQWRIERHTIYEYGFIP